MNDCPAREQLARLLAEGLAGPEAERVEAHVQGCSRCQQILDALAPDGRARPAGAGTRCPEGAWSRAGVTRTVATHPSLPPSGGPRPPSG
jgi:Putative zinc-finger